MTHSTYQQSEQLTAPAWRVRRVALSADGTRLEADVSQPDKRRPARPPEGLLTGFCALAGADLSDAARRRAILAFAHRFGLLGLCESHRLPAAGCPSGCAPWQRLDPWESPAQPGGPWLVDALEDWTLWARRFTGTIAIARAITRRTSTRAVDVEAAFAQLPAWHARMDLLRDPRDPASRSARHITGAVRVAANGKETALPVRPWRRQSRAAEGLLLRQWLNALLEMAAVRRQVVAGDGHQLLAISDAYAESCPLFGALVIELIGECTGVASQALCRHCQRGFRPRHQNQTYCPACRKAKMPQKRAQQHRRTRLRTAGRSTRGRPLRADRDASDS